MVDISSDRQDIKTYPLKWLQFEKEQTIDQCNNAATQIFPSHPGDKITCSPPPSMTQLRGGCLKAVTLTLSSILPNHPPTVPPNRGGGGQQERGRQADSEVV